MSQFNSTEYANTLATPIVFNRPQVEGGRVRTIRGTYTFAAQASGSIINLFELPAGARVLQTRARMSATHGGTTTIAIGDSGSATKYRAAATLTANAVIEPTAAAIGATDAAAIVGVDAPYTSPTVIFITTGAGAALPGVGRAYIEMDYVVD
jgi:hypothetical protein